jgi:lipopolysaccharide export system protein LptA
MVMGWGAPVSAQSTGPTATPPSAAPPAERKPVTISADRLEVDRKKFLARYSGNVVAVDRGRCVTITSDEMDFNFDDKMEEIQKAVAQGQVRITYQDKRSVSDRADYYPKEERAVLSGDPKVWQQEDVLVGSEIEIFFKEDRSIVRSDGKRRVVSVFTQREKQQGKRSDTASRGDCN